MFTEEKKGGEEGRMHFSLLDIAFFQQSLETFVHEGDLQIICMLYVLAQR